MKATMDLREMRLAAPRTSGRGRGAKTRDARVELVQVVHLLAMTAEICGRLERIEAAIRAHSAGESGMGVPSYPTDLTDILAPIVPSAARSAR